MLTCLKPSLHSAAFSPAGRSSEQHFLATEHVINYDLHEDRLPKNLVSTKPYYKITNSQIFMFISHTWSSHFPTHMSTSLRMTLEIQFSSSLPYIQAVSPAALLSLFTCLLFLMPSHRMPPKIELMCKNRKDSAQYKNQRKMFLADACCSFLSCWGQSASNLSLIRCRNTALSCYGVSWKAAASLRSKGNWWEDSWAV